MNYQEEYNKTAKKHQINSSEKTDNTIMIYNKVTTSIYGQTRKNKARGFQ